MAYTRHGFHVEGTPLEGDRPPVHRCGGPRMCKICKEDAGSAIKKTILDLAQAEAEKRWPKDKELSSPYLWFLNEGMASGFALGAQWATARFTKEG